MCHKHVILMMVYKNKLVKAEHKSLDDKGAIILLVIHRSLMLLHGCTMSSIVTSHL